MITFNYLMAQALLVLNAKLKKENTAKRVGGLFRDLLSFLENMILGIILKGELPDQASIEAVVSPVRGDTYKAADTGHYWCYDGTQWNDIGEIIPGDVATKAELGKEIQHVNPYMVQNTEIYKPSTLQDFYLDVSRIIKSVELTITGNFRKSNGIPRRIKLRSCQYLTASSELVINLDVESVDGVYQALGVARSTSSVISYSLSWGTLKIEFDYEKVNTFSVNTVATFEQGGLNESFVERAVLMYEYGLDIQGNKDLLNTLLYDVSLSLSNSYINSSGAIVSTANFRTTQRIKVKENEVITYYGNTSPGGASVSMYGYDINSNPVLLLLPTGNYLSGIKVVIPSGLGIDNIIAAGYAADGITIQKFGVEQASTSARKSINKSVRFVGHSIWRQDARLYNGTTDIARGNQTLLREQFNFLSDSGNTYCYSGNSLGGLTTSDTASIMNKTSTWTGTTGDIWTLDSITNDFKRNIPIGTISDYDNATGITTYYGALRAYRDKVIELSGATATVICSNALRRDNGGYNTNTINSAGHGLLDYEKAIMTVAKLNKWYFVDQFRLSGITDNTLSSTTLDGLHPNDFGYTLCVLPWITTFDIIYNKLLQ